MSDQLQAFLYVGAVSDESPVGLCQQVGVSQEAVLVPITRRGCWSRQADAACKKQDCWSGQRYPASLETGALNLDELRDTY